MGQALSGTSSKQQSRLSSVRRCAAQDAHLPLPLLRWPWPVAARPGRQLDVAALLAPTRCDCWRGAGEAGGTCPETTQIQLLGDLGALLAGRRR